MPRLIIGNVTSEYMFGCALESFGAKGAAKQHAISTRTAWLLRDGDALLTHRPLTEEFRDYLAATLGLDLSTVTFLSAGAGGGTGTGADAGAGAGAEEGAFLDHGTLLSPGLLGRLRDLTGPDWQLLPYLYDRTIAELARRLDLSPDAHPAFFDQGGA
ncbi:preATP grasp domain-containing protein, partial [Streptomyces sp. NPDC001919]